MARVLGVAFLGEIEIDPRIRIDGEPILIRNERGEFRGRVKIDRVKPGCLQGYWPEVNVVVPAGCLDPSGVPDYNAVVEVVPQDKQHAASVP